MAERMPSVLDCRVTGHTAVELDLLIKPDLLWFQGHFPDSPILPGVVQLDWVVQFARNHLRIELPAAREFQIKFKAVIVPLNALTLSLRVDAAKNRLNFDYRRGSDVCSIGTVFL